MKKVFSIILYVLAIAAIIFTVIEPSSDALGIPPAVISTGLLIITTIKEIIEKLQKLSPAEAAEFANSSALWPSGTLKKRLFSADDVKEWRNNK